MKSRYAFIWMSVLMSTFPLAAQQTNETNKEVAAAMESPAPATNAAIAATTNTVTATTPSTVAPAVTNTNIAAVAVPSAQESTTNHITVKPLAPGQKGLRFNFRGVPLETVLNYLSEAAGFIIVKDTEVRGRVDAWSYELLTKEEAVQLLNTVLYRNGYAAIQNERTLTIVSKDEAKKRDIQVIKESDPTKIPKADVIVTQIIPVRYANALQLTKDLLPLLPTSANMTANESANALVITDTQANIRRMALIVNALDTSISGISKIKAIRLNYADAKELVNIVKELYPAPSSSGRSSGGRGGGNQEDMRAMFMARMGGGPGGGGPQGPTSTGSSEAKMAASRVTAVADERNNVLVVSAPDEILPHIEALVAELDKNAEDLTEFRVFHLSNSDPIEMTTLLTQLFPDETRTSTGGGRSSIMFGGMGGRGMMGGMNRGSGSSQSSSYAQKKGRVVAVPDQRTSSVIVSAASEMMPQIAAMIAQLDANPAKAQKVYVFPLENADVANVETILRGMFEGQNSRNYRSNTQNSQNNQLNNRSLFTQGQNNSSSRASSQRSTRGGGGF